MLNPMPQNTTQYTLLAKQLTGLLDSNLIDRGLIDSQRNFLSNQAQFAALVYQSMTDISWAGFYWMNKATDLTVGSYQGPIACASIELGEGVCGKVAEHKQSLVVADVNQFDGHIACDVGSQSELVCPVINRGELIGVFDMDSYSRGRFTLQDQLGIEALLKIFVEKTDFKS